MANQQNERSVPEEQQEKTQGDKLDAVLDEAVSESTGLSQDPGSKASKDSERKPAAEPLK